jgi:hypothetical protein
LNGVEPVALARIGAGPLPGITQEPSEPIEEFLVLKLSK